MLCLFKKVVITWWHTVAFGLPVISLYATLALHHSQLKSTLYPLDCAALNLVIRTENSWLYFLLGHIFNIFLCAVAAAAVIFFLSSIHLETKDLLIRYFSVMASCVMPDSLSWITSALSLTECCSILSAPLWLLFLLVTSSDKI